MNIASFFPTEDATEEELQIEEYKKCIFKLVNRGYMNTQQYTYYVEFVKISGTVCNINQFIEHIKILESKNNSGTNCRTLNKSVNTDDHDSLVIDFKIITSKAFKKFFRYKDSTDDFRVNRNICYYLTRSDTIDLTREQKIAMKNLYEFLIDIDRKTYGLYGYAGTGKTTTMVEFVSYLIRNKYLYSVAFTAPTNKAVNVIKAKFKPHLKKIIESMFDRTLEPNFNFDDELEFLEQKNILIKFLTIHKLLMFQTDYSISGDMIFVRDTKTGSMISQFELVIIDECSMISMDMIDSIFEEIRYVINGKSKGYKRIPKIIFTGDPAQLPPVNEIDSSIFCQNSEDLSFGTFMDAMNFRLADTVMSDAKGIMEYRYNILIKDLENMDTFLLQNVVRSRIDNVTKVCHEFRKWIKKKSLPNLKPYMRLEGVYFYENNQQIDKTQSMWFKKFLNSIKNGDTSIILTWTNRQTDIYNQTIRKIIFKSNKINKFEKNDILMLSEFYGLDLGEEFVKQKLYTSEQIKVIDAKTTQVPINKFEMITNYGLRKMKNYVKIEDKIHTLINGLNELYCEKVTFTCWILKVHKFGENDTHTMTIIVVDDTDADKYNRMKSESGIAIKNFSKQLLNQYKSSPKQIEKSIIKPLWKQWNKIYVEPFANVNYGYSITCHKAQGSNFYDVFVDIGDVLLNPTTIEAKKCVYTAVTRASNELYLLI